MAAFHDPEHRPPAWQRPPMLFCDRPEREAGDPIPRFMVLMREKKSSTVSKQESPDAPEHDEQDPRQQKDAVARNALFITHGSQALDTACGQIIHQLWIVGRRPVKII